MGGGGQERGDKNEEVHVDVRSAWSAKLECIGRAVEADESEISGGIREGIESVGLEGVVSGDNERSQRSRCLSGRPPTAGDGGKGSEAGRSEGGGHSGVDVVGAGREMAGVVQPLIGVEEADGVVGEAGCDILRT